MGFFNLKRTPFISLTEVISDISSIIYHNLKLKRSNFTLFLVVVLFTILNTLLIKYRLDIDTLIYNFYSEQFAQEQLEQLIEYQQKWSWLGYAIIPLLILIRSSLVTLCLSVGNFFYNMDEVEHPKFSKFFRIALLGEFVEVTERSS